MILWFYDGPKPSVVMIISYIHMDICINALQDVNLQQFNYLGSMQISKWEYTFQIDLLTYFVPTQSC